MPCRVRDHEEESPEYKAGYQSRRDGVAWAKNPYREGSILSIEWYDGWSDANDEIRKLGGNHNAL